MEDSSAPRMSFFITPCLLIECHSKAIWSICFIRCTRLDNFQYLFLFFKWHFQPIILSMLQISSWVLEVQGGVRVSHIGWGMDFCYIVLTILISWATFWDWVRQCLFPLWPPYPFLTPTISRIMIFFWTKIYQCGRFWSDLTCIQILKIKIWRGET